MFSDRLPPHAETNRLTRAIAALHARGVPFTDLTASNPTRAGIAYPADLLAPLADPQGLVYEPDPRGLAAARAAVAADHARRGACVDPAHVVLTASTSEAYTWLYKLLCTPGERVLVPRSNYPLFEHLTRLEGVPAVPYNLEYHGPLGKSKGRCWLARPTNAWTLLVEPPNNPIGFVRPGRPNLSNFQSILPKRAFCSLVGKNNGLLTSTLQCFPSPAL